MNHGLWWFMACFTIFLKIWEIYTIYINIPAKAVPRNPSPVLVVVHEDPNFVCKGMRCGKTYPPKKVDTFFCTHTRIYTYIYIDWNPFSHPLSITHPTIHFSVCVLNTWICFLPVCFLGDALGLYPRQYISEERNVIPECPELNLRYFYQSSVGHQKIWHNIQQKDTPNEKKRRQRDGAEHWTE